VSLQSSKIHIKSFSLKINKIEDSKTDKPFGHKTTSATTRTNINGGTTILGTTQTEIRRRAFSVANKDTNRKIAGRGSMPISPCLDQNGKAFWPKINTTENGAPIEALQDQDFQF
jgi:hypothetical protein